ncbi:MAG: hypothetical protein DHS20C01_27490 [marine bacterium B5-7]|nr:MAG: hypothetical protein DHS20C01_27490 [marine bacterium B5-7]
MADSARNALHYPLPRVRHLPGSGSVADHEVLDAVLAQCPLQTEVDKWYAHSVYLYGWRMLQGGFYWEAHEIWECVWQRCPANSLEKLLMQALIQTANALLKRRLGQDRAQCRLIAHVLSLFDEIQRRSPEPTHLMGVNTTAFSQMLISLNTYLCQSISAK